ncbi:MAG TPA: hypothetical protein VFQ23_05260 [Anaerolineales bacterium]|nr:hypothetical protein [Anaerolineales bacterium]
MNRWRKRLSALVVVPGCFHLLTYQMEAGFQIMEPKDIPHQTPIVSSALNSFFHEKLVDHLLKNRAGIEKVQRVHLFRKSNNFTSDDYFTFTVKRQWPLETIMADDFHPELINTIADFSESVFFSRNYYNQVSSETDLTFQELPVISLIPLGEEDV